MNTQDVYDLYFCHMACGGLEHQTFGSLLEGNFHQRIPANLLNRENHALTKGLVPDGVAFVKVRQAGSTLWDVEDSVCLGRWGA